MKRYDINYRADCGPAEGRVRSREGWGGRQVVLHQRHRHHQPLLGSCRSPPLLPPWVVAVSSVHLCVTSPIAVLIPLLALLFQPAASTGGGYGAPSTGYGGEDNTETSEVLSSSRPNETTNNLSLGLNEALTSHWVIQSCYYKLTKMTILLSFGAAPEESYAAPSPSYGSPHSYSRSVSNIQSRAVGWKKKKFDNFYFNRRKVLCHQVTWFLHGKLMVCCPFQPTHLDHFHLPDSHMITCWSTAQRET